MPKSSFICPRLSFFFPEKDDSELPPRESWFFLSWIFGPEKIKLNLPNYYFRKTPKNDVPSRKIKNWVPLISGKSIQIPRDSCSIVIIPCKSSPPPPTKSPFFSLVSPKLALTILKKANKLIWHSWFKSVYRIRNTEIRFYTSVCKFFSKIRGFKWLYEYIHK